MKYTEEMSNKLNELLERTYDAEKGFKQVAEKVDNKTLEKFFLNHAKQRFDFGQELKSEIRLYGETPEKGGSAKASLHRSWIDFRSLVSSNTEEALLKEVHRGEKEAISTYNDILQDKDFVLPPSTENLLMRHRNAIRDTLETADIFESAIS